MGEGGNIISMEKNLPRRVSEVICLKCLTRWIGVRPEETLLKEIECPCCGMIGYVIETGETVGDDSQ